jgi:hypothetical protein
MDADKAYNEIAFIKKVITDSQKVLMDNGKIYILWSCLAILCIVLKYGKSAMGLDFNNLWVYLAVILIGSLLTHLLKNFSTAERHVRTFSQKILEGIWMSWGISIVILVIVGYLSGRIDDRAIPAIIAAIMGSGQFVSGMASHASWIRNAAIGWWSGAIVLFWLPGEYAIALLGVMLIVFQLVPGVMLYRKWNKELIQENQ